MKSRLTQVALIFGTSAVTCAGVQLLSSYPASGEKLAVDESRKTEKVINDPAFHKQILQIAAEYKDYGKVDDLSRWAPWLCSAPLPPKARLSNSKDDSTHGKKMYFLFAKDRESYVKRAPAQVGQVIVKQSWLPTPDASAAQLPSMPAPGTQADLFIMFKADQKTRNTDEGWVYSTVTSDGKTVTSAGRVQSCMKCHLSAPNGRLFGLKELYQK